MKLLAILFIAGCVVASQANVIPINDSNGDERFQFPSDLEQIIKNFTALFPKFPQPLEDIFAQLPKFPQPIPISNINATELAENLRTLVSDLQKVENVKDLRQIDWATTLYPLFNILFNYLLGPILTQVLNLVPAAALPTLFGGSTTVEASVGYIIYSLYNPTIYLLNTYLFG